MRYTLLIILFLFSACSRSQEDPIVTQMRVRKIQSHTYVGCGAKAVIKEMLAVLQDEGYMVKNVSSDLGLVTAEKNINVEQLGKKFWAYVFSGKRGPRYKKHSTVEITSNATEETGNTKLRINFLVRTFDNLGNVVDVQQIFDEEIYTFFFNKIQKGLLQ